MSIFKSTLDPTTSAQLKARESVVSTSGSRDDNFLKYTTGKNSWVRMTSFVNYNNSDALSKKYILEGGTLYNSGDDQFSLRAGVGKQSGAYASNLDINTISGKREIVRPFGLRPMPGITQASVINKSAYGSLREATVEFLAWDKHQLEELELLFMRPGYTVFLEWGWSQYLDHGEAEVNKTPSDIKIKYFDALTLNPFDITLTDEKIYKKIDEDIKLTKGNYDAMLGYVKNFSWQLLPNGGFQCTTVLISRGEVLSSLKASTTTNFPFYNANAQNPDQVLATMFEKILLNIIGSINDAAYSSLYRATYIPTAPPAPGELYTANSNPVDLRAQADAEFAKINSEIQRSYPSIDLNKDTFIKYCDGGTEGTAIEYIKMDAFIALLNTYLIPKQKSKDITSIEIPGNTPCLASEDSVSIDPTTCLIKNKKATFIADSNEGFDPYVDNVLAINGATSTQAILEDFLNQGTTSLGSIGNIYISINKILTIFREKANDPDGLDILVLLQEVLKAISFALGGINDFQTHSTRSTARIIDKYYLESGQQKDKFEFNLVGLNSICRDVKINSRIFAEQSTMIGIGAAAGGINNLGDIYTSTQQQFNKGLTDRVLNNIQYINQPLSVGGTQLTENQAYYYSIYRTLEGLKKYVTDKVLGIPNGGANFQYTIIPQPSEVSNAGNALRTIHYQLNGKDVNFKALIPFELEITLDGIGGFIIGQIFTVDNSILPQDYYNKNLGFIITGISHKLQNNDWITELKTQICLLDTAEELKVIGIEQNKVKKIINKLSQQAQVDTYLVSALADYLTFITFDSLLFPASTNRLTLYINSTDLLSSKTKAEVEIIGTSTTPPKNRDLIYNIFKNSVYKETDIDSWLQNWHSDPSVSSSPNYPQNYNDFLSQTNAAGVKVPFKILSLKNFILTDYVVNKYNSDPSKVESLTTLAWSPAVYNAYKEIWDNSFLSKVTAANPLTYITKPGIIKAQDSLWLSNNVPLTKIEFIFKFPKSTIPVLYNGSISANGFFVSQKSFQDNGVDVTEKTFAVPSKNGDALNPMRIGFYNYFQNNTSALDLSLYLSATPVVTSIVNIAP